MAKRKKNITLFDDQIKRGNQICNKIDRNFSQMVGELIDEKHKETFNCNNNKQKKP